MNNNVVNVSRRIEGEDNLVRRRGYNVNVKCDDNNEAEAGRGGCTADRGWENEKSALQLSP